MALKKIPIFTAAKRNILEDPILDNDIGLTKCRDLVIQWSSKTPPTRSTNQYTFRNLETSNYIDDIFLISTFMFILNTTHVKNQPSDLLALESCWDSTVGTFQQETGRYRSSVAGTYFFNYAIVGTVYKGPAVHEWSHRCNNCLCVNPSHLIDEPHNLNVSRNTCPGILVCEDTHRIWVLCKHVDKCKHVHLLPKNTIVTLNQYYNLQ